MPIDHIVLDEVRMNLVSDSKTRLALSISAFQMRIASQALQTLARTLLPDHPLSIHIDDQSMDGRCTLEIQARQMGVRARIRARLEPDVDERGSILIKVRAASRWSPADNAMLSIASSNLTRLARDQPELSQRESGVYQLNVQTLIRERLTESGVPVRWATRLERIDGLDGAIVATFVPDSPPDESSKDGESS